MKRLLSFLPALLAGLAAGWFLTKLIPGPKTTKPSPAQSSPQAAATPLSPPAGRAAGRGREQWLKMLEARTLPPVSANFAIQQSTLNALSPARRNLEIELTRSTLSNANINGTSLGFPFSGGDAGFAETCARLARTEPGRALFQIDMAANVFPGRWSQETLDRARRLVIREWLRKNPQEAVEKITGTDRAPSFQRGQRLKLMMEEWAAIDPSAAAAALPSLPENGPGFDRQSLAETLLQTWQEKDAAAAREWASAKADPAWRDSLTAMTDEFAAKDPAAKTSILLAAPQRDSGKLTSVLAGWLSTDSAAALEKLAAIPPGDPFWSRDAANASQRWAMETRTAPDTETSDNGTETSRNSPERFLENLQTIPAGPQREALLKGLIDFGASNDPLFAVRLLAELGESPARAEAVGTLTELWMRKDPVHTSEWLASLPPGTDSRHAGVARFAENLAPDDPERAAAWATTLPDGYWQKEPVLKTILETWQAKDPAAATAWGKSR
ncbi:MAG: hypothetical protein V4726_04850 [Verrucomicrobiota bacterium]